MSLIQIDETDGISYVYLLVKSIGDGQTLHVLYDEDAGVQQIFTSPIRVLQDMPDIEAMDLRELQAAGFVFV